MLKWSVAPMLILMLLPALSGCGASESGGPPSTETRSTSMPKLADRVRFLQTYVTFDRQFEQLEFDIFYKNNGGGFVPGPSDWDIQLVAKVPQNELHLWTDGMQPSPGNGQ